MSTCESSPFSNHDPALYDALIDWDKRLAYETPFYRQLFESRGVRWVLDVACGTGRHVALFHSWGLKAEGADISPRMIEYCRTAWGENENLRWTLRAFDQPSERPGEFDTAICVGNSLALAADLAQVHAVIKALLDSVSPKGVVVVQVVNLWRLPEGLTRWDKCKRFRLDGKDHIRIKGIHRTGSRGFIDVIDLDLVGESLESRFSAPTFLGLESSDLIAAARTGGARQVEAYGSFQMEPYDSKTSTDLILVCDRS